MNGIEVVATTGEPAFAVDLEGRIIAWNRAAEYSLGYRRSEVMGRHCWRVLQGKDLSANRYCCQRCALREMASKGEPIHRTKLAFRNALGAQACFSVSTLVVQGKEGREVVHLFGDGARDEQAALHLDEASATNNACLSPRQLEVLKHLSHGRSTEQIAESLCISSTTVRHHIQKILSGLKVHSRLEAVAVARRIGLL